MSPKKINFLISHISSFFLVDRPVFLSLLTRFWMILSGIVSILFVSKYLSLEVQGYYYTFGSLIALQIFAELGLNNVIIQFVSHEMSKLKWSKNKILFGDTKSKKRLQSIAIFSFLWFSFASVLLLIFLIPGGIFFFSSQPNLHLNIHPDIAWTLVVFSAAVLLIENAAFAVLEGCNKVSDVLEIRLTQTVFSSLALWISLKNNLGLYSLAVSTFVAAFIGFAFIFYRYKFFLLDLYGFKKNKFENEINWRNDIWPFQWRIAVSWASGYFVYQIFTPIVFANQGPIQAAQLGMSLQIIFALNASSLAWIATKAPIFGKLVAEKKFNQLDSMFFGALKSSTFFILFSSVILLIIIFMLGKYESPYATRIIPFNHFLILFLASLANNFISSFAYYLRAFKEEKLMVVSIVLAIITSSLAIFIIPILGELGAVLAYSFGLIFIGLPWVSIIFFRVRKKVN